MKVFKMPMAPIKWWQRIVFMFLPTYSALNGDEIIYFKLFRGRLYVMSEEFNG